jgi:hypothetical protein
MSAAERIEGTFSELQAVESEIQRVMKPSNSIQPGADKQFCLLANHRIELRAKLVFLGAKISPKLSFAENLALKRIRKTEEPP